MKLHDPFLISARLAPALRIGDKWDGEKAVAGKAWLSLISTGQGDETRSRYTFAIDDGDLNYEDNSMQSGCGHRSVVDAFSGFLSFLLAAVESYEYEQRNGLEFGKGENTDLLPRNVVEWAAEHKYDLESLQCDIQDEDGNPREELISA